MYNYDEGYYELENPIEFEEPKRRKNPKKEAGILNFKDPKMLLAIGAGAYLLWCFVNKQKTGTWSWKPWSVAGIQRQQIAQQQRMAMLRAAVQPPQQPGETAGQPVPYVVGQSTRLEPGLDRDDPGVFILMP